jgi:hypothetical protein
MLSLAVNTTSLGIYLTNGLSPTITLSTILNFNSMLVIGKTSTDLNLTASTLRHANNTCALSNTIIDITLPSSSSVVYNYIIGQPLLFIPI